MRSQLHHQLRCSGILCNLDIYKSTKDLESAFETDDIIDAAANSRWRHSMQQCLPNPTMDTLLSIQILIQAHLT